MPENVIEARLNVVSAEVLFVAVQGDRFISCITKKGGPLIAIDVTESRLVIGLVNGSEPIRLLDLALADDTCYRIFRQIYDHLAEGDDASLR